MLEVVAHHLLSIFQDKEGAEGEGGSWTEGAGRCHAARAATAGIHQAEGNGNSAAPGVISWVLSSKKKQKWLVLNWFFRSCFDIWLSNLFQEDAKNFITLENLDQRIEEALDNPKNYNFAINKEGKVVKQTVLQWHLQGKCKDTRTSLCWIRTVVQGRSSFTLDLTESFLSN